MYSHCHCRQFLSLTLLLVYNFLLLSFHLGALYLKAECKFPSSGRWCFIHELSLSLSLSCSSLSCLVPSTHNTLGQHHHHHHQLDMSSGPVRRVLILILSFSYLDHNFLLLFSLNFLYNLLLDLINFNLKSLEGWKCVWRFYGQPRGREEGEGEEKARKSFDKLSFQLSVAFTISYILYFFPLPLSLKACV